MVVEVDASSSFSSEVTIAWKRRGARVSGSSERPSGAFGVGATSGTGARRLRIDVPCACGATVGSRNGLSDSNVMSERLDGKGGRRPSGVMHVYGITARRYKHTTKIRNLLN